jgi:hypothetical protein
MLKDRLKQLFEDYDPQVQRVIIEVLKFEQENISMKTPRYSEPIDAVVTQIARQSLDRDDTEDLAIFDNRA